MSTSYAGGGGQRAMREEVNETGDRATYFQRVPFLRGQSPHGYTHRIEASSVEKPFLCAQSAVRIPRAPNGHTHDRVGLSIPPERRGA